MPSERWVDYAPTRPNRRRVAVRWLRNLSIVFGGLLVMLVLFVALYVSPAIRAMQVKYENAESRAVAINAAIANNPKFTDVEVTADSSGTVWVDGFVETAADQAGLQQIANQTSPPTPLRTLTRLASTTRPHASTSMPTADRPD
jgi:hypothetical protein